jgi:hypothetical protein
MLSNEQSMYTSTRRLPSSEIGEGWPVSVSVSVPVIVENIERTTGSSTARLVSTVFGSAFIGEQSSSIVR